MAIRESKRKREWAKFSSQYLSKPRKDEVEVDKEAVDRIVGRRTFEYFDRPTRGLRFYIFRDKGEELIGKLVSHAIPNIRRNSSYAIEIETDEVVEIFANRTLHKQLEGCFMERIRIVYLGREQNNFGHAKKVYRVYKEKAAKLDKIQKKLKQRKEADDGK